MSSNYRDNYYGSILDPLHGDIKLSEIEKWIISQPIFSRLRKVKQNTFLYYVFPSANHTRFEHSIGVMHLAGKIFDSCKENYATGQKKKEKYSIIGETSFFDLNCLEDREATYYQELRLAALLHDIGHGPLSHLFDKFSISKESFLKIIEESTDLKAYSLAFTGLIEKNENKVEHEIISCVFIFVLIAELKKENIRDVNKFSPSAKHIVENLSAERIIKLIEPKFECDYGNFNDSEGNDYTLFFSRIISAFPIDADRMDYLLRDSYFSGVTYGIYDINRIFSSFMATINEKQVFLTFKESGLDSMLRFIQSRSHLYNQVYFHKTNRAANSMLSYATKSGREKKIKLLDKFKDVNFLREFYIKNSDEVFINYTVLKDVVENKIEKEVLTELLNRKLFKRVYQVKIVLLDKELNEKDKIEEIQKRIDKRLEELINTDSIYATTDLYQNNTFKDSEKAILIAIKAEKRYQFDKEWKSINREFSLMNMNVLMLRIYIRRTFTESIDFESKKKKILESISSEINELEKYSN